ncbi:hypothetical protein BpHYR1_012699 [Brachionus plicatilis]|uniref:Uncharacterized protein n=1 Tax=Brachionus plicatilis TaxID=10195 RepID=A0A3M7QIC2_BRAPC|nr:hypothetical protein BpHYR1_012699 [Brachionus plicatilis]
MDTNYTPAHGKNSANNLKKLKKKKFLAHKFSFILKKLLFFCCKTSKTFTPLDRQINQLPECVSMLASLVPLWPAVLNLAEAFISPPYE